MKGENLLETAGRFWRKNDLVRQNAAQGRRYGPEEKNNFSRKTRQNYKDLEKKVCRKIPRLSTEIRSTKVGPDLISHGFEVACPYSFSSPWYLL